MVRRAVVAECLLDSVETYTMHDQLETGGETCCETRPVDLDGSRLEGLTQGIEHRAGGFGGLIEECLKAT